MLVSVVTPVLNGERYLAEALHSVSSQTYRNIEHIVVDGGSCDGTVGVVRRFPHCRLLEGRDSGMYDAVNKGLDVSSGNVLAYLNCDDRYHPDTVLKAVRFFEANPEVDMIYGDLDLIDAESRFIARYRSPHFNLKLFATLSWSLAQPTFFWRRRLYRESGTFRADLKVAGDYEFFLRIGKRYPVRYVKGLVACFRTHSASLSATLVQQNEIEVNRIREELHPDIRRFTNPVSNALANGAIKLANTRMYLEKMMYLLRTKN